MRGSQLALTQSRSQTSLLLSLVGEFGRAGSAQLERAFDGALETPTELVVLDLAAVTFLDLGAVRTLLRMHALMCEYSVDLRIVPPRGSARRIFTLTRVGHVLPVSDPRAGISSRHGVVSRRGLST